MKGSASRFALVGVVNTAIDFTLFLVLTTAGLPIVLANLCSTSAGLACSYVGNSRFAFRERGAGGIRSALLFLLTTGVGLWIIQPLVLLGVTAALGTVLPHLAVAPVAKVAAIGFGLLWNYGWYSNIVFRRPRTSTPASPAEAVTPDWTLT